MGQVQAVPLAAGFSEIKEKLKSKDPIQEPAVENLDLGAYKGTAFTRALRDGDESSELGSRKGS